MPHTTRAAAVMLSFLLTSVAVAPVYAASLRASDVAPVMSTRTGSSQLRLRNISQVANPAVASRVAQDPQNGGASSASAGNGTAVVAQDPSAPSIETIELGEVTGTVCDCGEILAPVLPGGGGFPLFPLFALGAIPLAFVDFGGEESDTAIETPISLPTPTPAMPTPSPSPAPVPEPATLLLLGSGLAALAARARRRRRREGVDESALAPYAAGMEV